MPSFMFDSCALLAFLQGETGAEKVASILRRAYSSSYDLLICLINLGEIIYLTKRRFGDEKKIEILGRIYQLGFKVLSVPDSLVFQAAELKAQYALSYADCFALACSINHSAILVTGDSEFASVAHLVAIEWIR